MMTVQVLEGEEEPDEENAKAKGKAEEGVSECLKVCVCVCAREKRKESQSPTEYLAESLNQSLGQEGGRERAMSFYGLAPFALIAGLDEYQATRRPDSPPSESNAKTMSSRAARSQQQWAPSGM